MAHHTRAAPSHSGHPHALSLKVLRLSRPTLATQSPLPPTSFGGSGEGGCDIPASASLAVPGARDENLKGGGGGGGFPLTPLLALPAAFGAAYVGEGFGCTLCVNCEAGTAGDGKAVGGVRVRAELQSPGKQEGVGLELRRGDGSSEGESEGGVGDGDADEDEDAGVDISPGETLQYTLSQELKEEGPHVLAVTVSYTETLHTTAGGASGGRARTFRKLYQFVAQPLIAVRSKVTELKRRGQGEGRRWVLEAQLENVGETAVVLESVGVKEREGIEGRGVHIEEGGGDDGRRENTVLKPQDVEQVMFLLREEGKGDGDGGGGGRIPLAQVCVRWRSAMGEMGSLTTGWLASRPR